MTAMDANTLWTVEDVANYLKVPVKTIYDWRTRNYGPRGIKVGRYVRFDAATVVEWFKNLGDQAH